MTKFTLATALTCTLGLGLFATANAQESPVVNTAATPTQTAAAPATAGALKIGYTNVNYILLASPQTKVIKSQLETASKQYEKAIQDKMKEMEDKFAVYQKNEATMMESIKQDKQTELRQLESSIRTLQDNAQTELKTRENELVKPELDKIYAGINAAAKENGYTFILNSDQVILYSAEGNDVSDLVLKKLGYPKPKEDGDAETTKPATPAPASNPEKKAAPGGTGRPVPTPKKKK